METVILKPADIEEYGVLGAFARACGENFRDDLLKVDRILEVFFAHKRVWQRMVKSEDYLPHCLRK